MKITLIGCGNWGRYILRDLLTLGAEVQVVARSNSSIQNAKEYGATHIISAVSEITEIDGAVVATTIDSHSQVMHEVLDLFPNLPIFCEKPLTASLSEAHKFLPKNKDNIFVMEKWRYHQGICCLRDLSESGRYGKLRGIHTTRLSQANPHIDSDAVWVLIPHDLSIVKEIIGHLPQAISANGQIYEKTFESLSCQLGGQDSPWINIEVSARSTRKERRIELHLENHLEILAKELMEVDFTHTLPINILPNGESYVWQVDLALDWYRKLLLSGTNRIPLGMAGHRMDLYRKLAHGWRVTPEDVPTDLYMWQQILEHPGVRCSSLVDITVLHFASPERSHMSASERYQELESHYSMIQDPLKLSRLKEEIFEARLRAGMIFEMAGAVHVNAVEAHIVSIEEEERQLRAFLLLKENQLQEGQKALEALALQQKEWESESAHLHGRLEKQARKLDRLHLETNSRAYRLAVFCRETLRKIGLLKILRYFRRDYA